MNGVGMNGNGSRVDQDEFERSGSDASSDGSRVNGGGHRWPNSRLHIRRDVDGAETSEDIRQTEPSEGVEDESAGVRGQVNGSSKVSGARGDSGQGKGEENGLGGKRRGVAPGDLLGVYGTLEAERDEDER